MSIATDLTQIIRARLEPGACCFDLKECVAIDRKRFHAAGPLADMQVETIDPVTPADNTTWAFLWTEYYPHVLACDNPYHPVPVLRINPSTTEPLRRLEATFTPQHDVHLLALRGPVFIPPTGWDPEAEDRMST